MVFDEKCVAGFFLQNYGVARFSAALHNSPSRARFDDLRIMNLQVSHIFHLRVAEIFNSF